MNDDISLNIHLKENHFLGSTLLTDFILRLKIRSSMSFSSSLFRLPFVLSLKENLEDEEIVKLYASIGCREEAEKALSSRP